jgi:hypothetical protein
MPHDSTSLFARVAATLFDDYSSHSLRSLGQVLLCYARRHDLDDDGLARLLGCPASLLPEVALYREEYYGLGQPSNFRDIASRYGLSFEVVEAIEQDEQQAQDEGRERKQAAARSASDEAWAWFLDFAGRVPELRASPRALAFFLRCVNFRPGKGDLSFHNRAWFHALPSYRGQDLIDIAREAVARRADHLYREVGHSYSPLRCALTPTTPPPDAVRAWSDGTVPRLAAAAIAGDAAALLMLPDALLDAGCEDEGLMDHLRQPVEHPDWCWALHSAALPVTKKGDAGRAPEVAPPPPPQLLVRVG